MGPNQTSTPGPNQVDIPTGREIVLRGRDCTEQFGSSYVWTIDPAHELIVVAARQDSDGRVIGCEIGIRALHGITSTDTFEVRLKYPDRSGDIVSDWLALVLQPVDGTAEVIIVDVSSQMEGNELLFAQGGILYRLRTMDAETVTGGWLAGDTDNVGDCHWSNPVAPNPKAQVGSDLELMAQNLTSHASTRPDFTHAAIDALQDLGVHESFAARADLSREIRIVILTAGGSNCLSEEGSELLGQEAMKVAQGSDVDAWLIYLPKRIVSRHDGENHTQSLISDVALGSSVEMCSSARISSAINSASLRQ